jgi:methyl-accepting chemotaxis protein
MDNRRQKYYVEEGDHKSLLLGALVLILALIFIASGLFYILANKSLEKATYRAHFEAMHNTMQMLLPYLLIVNIIGLVAVLILAFFLTHKISGPAYHLIMDFKRFGDGDLTTRTCFRRGDRLKNVAAAFNEAIDSVQKSVTEVKKKVDQLSESVERIPDLKNVVDDITQTLDKLKT